MNISILISFFKIKDKNEILVVEIKADGDTSQKNKAKYCDGKDHYDELNKLLESKDLDWKSYFYFLFPEDITEFFQAIRENRYIKWKSGLMNELNAL